MKGAIFKYIDFYQYDKIIKEDAKIYITALNSSSEFLGSNISQFQQNNFRPTVSNWLKEYQIVINTLNSGNIQAGAFHIVKFMDTNKYIKYLKTDEQKNLRELLDLYNWLLNPIIYSDDEKIEQPSSYIQSQRFELPREISQPSAPKLPPVAPAPKNAPTLRPMGDMVDARIKNNELGIKEKTTFPKPQGVLQSIPTNRRVNPLPEVRPGLSMSPPANYQMPKKEIPVENVQEKIDKKLEDLEKRVK